jgi:DNA gyrase subunit A
MAGIIPTDINKEMKRAYLDYAMSVIVSRALPDVRDGLKPVQRRILYAMKRLGLTAGGKFTKSARVTGEVTGKYHPHGTTPVYEAIVRIAQDFSLRYPLIKGQGNFGSIDGDPPAAERYTEVKLTKISEELLEDIDKETVTFSPNYDGSEREPNYLPSKLPNLLLMGAEGIAVGMATKIPPHNTREVIDALIAHINTAEYTEKDTEGKLVTMEDGTPNPFLITFAVQLEQLLEHIKGPDFPTHGFIYGKNDIMQLYATGRSSIMMRGVIEEEELSKTKTALIISELPYQVNKANLVEKIADLVNDKKIMGITDLRDESNKEGIRVVIELRRDATPKQVINNLFKLTELQTNFPANVVALVDGTPQTLGLKDILDHYTRHRVDIVKKRSQYELKAAKARAHILEGYIIAIDNIDEVVAIIRKSETEQVAKVTLMAKFALSDIQTQAILEMQLRRLVGLEKGKIEAELAELSKKIAYLTQLISDVFAMLGVVKDELLEMKRLYGDDRKTKIILTKPGEVAEEELIENKEVLVALTTEGYIKKIPADTFKNQNRGGKGVAGMDMKEGDDIAYMVSAETHDTMLFFSNRGRVFQTRVWDIPDGTRTSKGKAAVNVISLQGDEKVATILPVKKKDLEESNLLFFTKLGTVKKTPFKDYANIRATGIIAITLDDDDELLLVKVTGGSENAFLASRDGKAIIFSEDEVRQTGRSSRGVRGIDLDGANEVVCTDVFTKKEFENYLFVLMENGIGKKTKLSEFKDQHRGGKGVKTADLDKKTGKVIFVGLLRDEIELIMTSMQGQVVKIPLGEVPSRSRAAKGVILMRFNKEGDKIASATLV